MPKCKNDESKSYKGDEPSPKGLGYCAHAEPEGSRKKGKDGNMWEARTVDSGSKRWIKMNENKLKKSAEKKIYTTWAKLSQGQLLIIYKNEKYKITSFKGKSKNKYLKMVKNFESEKDVKYIIWSAISFDILESFVNYINTKLSKKYIELLNNNNPLDVMSKYPSKFFNKEELYTKKDFTFK